MRRLSTARPVLMATAAGWAMLAAAPAIAQSQTPAQPGNELTADASELGEEEIVVTGVRGSLSRAIEVKREATTVVDSISQEELGKFPDRNVADSLGNVPGITVRRTRGAEGQNVTVRGLGQGFSIVTLNDRILPTDNGGRDFAFDVLPSEMISGADVYKGVQASLREGSIGGAINLRSARPFDYDGLVAFGSVEADYNDLSEKFGKKVTAVVSDTFADDTIGALLSVSWSKRKIRTDNLREYFIVSETEADTDVDFNGNGQIDADGPGYVYPSFYSPGTVVGTRERLGVTGALQFRPSDTFELTLDGLYSHYSTPTQNFAESNYIESARFVPGSIRVDSNNVVTGFEIEDLVPELVNYEEPRTVDTYLFGANASWKPSDRLTFTADGYWGRAERNSAGKERFVVAGATGGTGRFSTRADGLPSFDVQLSDGRPLSAGTDEDYRAHYIGITGANVRDDTYGIQLNGTWEAGDGFLRTITTGASFNRRTKNYDQFGNPQTECTFCGYPFTFAELGAQVIRPPRFDNILATQKGNFPRFFPTFDIDTYLDALTGVENNPNIIDPNTGLSYPTGAATQIVEARPVESYDISENVYAGYVQADFEAGAFRGNVGVRLVRTETVSRGAIDRIVSITKQPNQTANYDIVRSPAAAVEGKGSYTRALPSVNLSYDFTDSLKLRASAAKVIARPSIDQLSAASSDNSETGDFTKFNFGNPNLQPIEAKQADLSLEWYFAPGSILAGALFYKDIDNFITTGIDQETIAGQQFTVITVSNGDSGSVKGLELTLNYLAPNGFGVAANVTATDSKAKFGEISGQLEDVTPLSVNVSGLYERGPVSLKVTYSWDKRRTVQLDGFVEGLSVKGASYEDLSFSASVDLTETLELFVEGSNLLNETIRQYNTYGNVPAFYEENGRSYFAGLRARF